MILYHISAKKLITRCTFSMLAASLILCPAVFSGCSAKTENVKNTDAGSQDPISATAIKLNTAVKPSGTYTCEGDRGYLSGVGFSGGAGF